MENITITLNPEQARALLESIQWSKNAVEQAIERRPDDTRQRAKWGALDDVSAQLEEAKRDLWFGEAA